MPRARPDGQRVLTGWDRHTVKGSGTDAENTASVTLPFGVVEWTIKNASTGGLVIRIGSTLLRAEGTNYLELAQGESIDGTGCDPVFCYNPGATDGAIEVRYDEVGVSTLTALVFADA
jgi:hypothetical protein